MKTLYELLKDAGCEIDHHETDLYVKRTDEALKIILDYEAEHGLVSQELFTNQIDGAPWLDIPFRYDPAWPKHTRVIATSPDLLNELEAAHNIIHRLWEMACENNIPDSAGWPYMRQIERESLIKKAKGEA